MLTISSNDNRSEEPFHNPEMLPESPNVARYLEPHQNSKPLLGFSNATWRQNSRLPQEFKNGTRILVPRQNSTISPEFYDGRETPERQ